MNVRRQTRADLAQPPLLGIEAEAPAPAPQQLRGDPSRPETLRFGDWKIINQQAKAKLAKQTRHIFTNDNGTVFHLKTRKQYTAEDLVAEFGLTAVEARSCFLTLDN